MNRLNHDTMDRLPASVLRPRYDRRQLETGIIHLGIGNFHRAHQAVYTDTVLGTRGGDWGICGVSLRHPGVRDRMASQDNLYTVVEKEGADRRYRLIGAVADVIYAPEDPERLINRMTDPRIRIVSLTITEKGYHHDPASNRLNPSHPDIRHDLENRDTPRTAAGYIVKTLESRRAAGTFPFTVLSCDNLRENGHTLKTVVCDFASLIDDGLAQWIENEVAFPCTMVDRIVPPSTEADRHAAQNDLGLADSALIVTEPFCQWVLEDRFPSGRPAWDNAGAIFSSEVKAFETMKLRLLNGAHSTMAYLGYLSGKASVADCMAWEALRNLIHTLMHDEILPTVRTPSGYDAVGYIDALMARFANPGLNHSTWHIAMDGSQKLPPRLLDTIRAQLATHQPIDLLCLAVAAWMRFVCGWDENGKAIEISDPMAAKFGPLTHDFRNHSDETVERLLDLSEIFGSDLPRNPIFCSQVKNAFRHLCHLGAHETIRRVSGASR
jgi:fructuronate reductase